MKPYNREERQKMLNDAIEQFPAEFGLRAFPGDRFRISRRDSFVADDGETVMLYTQVSHNGEWLAFAKGTIEELKREMVKK